jgi:DNA repair ATPase RecN
MSVIMSPWFKYSTLVGDDGESLFLNIIDRAERHIDEVFNSIEDLKEHVKVFTKKSSQIESYIEKINDICDELGIPPETFITVNYQI